MIGSRYNVSREVVASAGVPVPRNRQQPCRTMLPTSRSSHVMGIHIDRKRHLELAWQRQQQLDQEIEKELSAGPAGAVWEVRNLAHLERIHEAAESNIVVLLAYSRSCGSCKKVISFLKQKTQQMATSKPGIVYCKHNIVNEFDFASDIARWFKVRHAPCFLVFKDGALADKITLPDSRARAHGPPRKIELILDSALLEMHHRLLDAAPESTWKPPYLPMDGYQ